MADALVRPADVGDASTIAALQLEIWAQAYPELLPATVLQTDPQVATQAWTLRLAAPDRALLAFEGPHPVGLAAVADPGDDGMGEVQVLLVLPRFARRGHGGRLLGAAAAALRGHGATHGCWWAPETDRSIERFLAGVGWQPDGMRRVLDTGEGRLVELRYSGPLDLTVA